MKIGITGHQRFKTPAAWVGVRAEIDRLFSRVEGSIIGLTSLAIGAVIRCLPTLFFSEAAVSSRSSLSKGMS